MVTYSTTNNCINVLFGKTRQAILSLLYNDTDKTFYLRQIVRDAGIGLGPAQRELKQLVDAGIINKTKIGNQVHYQINNKSPIHKEMKAIVAILKPAPSRFPVTERKLAVFCRKHHIRKLSLFGSVLRDDFNPDSDIDVLVEFEKGKTPGFAIIDIENELTKFAGRKIDLRTAGDLSRYFRDQVVKEAEVHYEAK